MLPGKLLMPCERLTSLCPAGFSDATGKPLQSFFVCTGVRFNGPLTVMSLADKCDVTGGLKRMQVLLAMMRSAGILSNPTVLKRRV